MLNAARNDCIFFIYPLLKNIENFFGKFFLNCPIEKKETPFLENAKIFGKFYSQNCVACFKGLKSPIGGGVTQVGGGIPYLLGVIWGVSFGAVAVFTAVQCSYTIVGLKRLRIALKCVFRFFYKILSDCQYVILSVAIFSVCQCQFVSFCQ